MKYLKQKDIDNYKNNIYNFINSERAKEFYTEKWCDIIIKNI